MTSDLTGRTSRAFGRVGPGSRVAGYLIEEQVGAGGMAVVFRARDEVLGRYAALKIIAPAMADDEEFRARFLRESRTVAAVDSLHIIPVYGAGEAEGLLYIATRYVPGGDLAALMRRSGGLLAPARAATLVEQVASALDAAHAAGLVHRDVKPQNILVDTVPERPEHAFLCDFGLSKGTSSSTGLTVSGQFLGTPDYSAPEQIRGDQVDGRADEYALACVAFALLTGTLPFHREETVATMFAHLQDRVPSLTRLRPELPFAADAVMARALAKPPGERYARCGDFAAALRQALVPARLPTAPAWAAPQRPALPRQPDPGAPADPAADPFAWLARQDGPRPPAGAQRQQPAALPGAPAARPAAQPARQPAQPGWRPARDPQPDAMAQHPSLPPAHPAGWTASWLTSASQGATRASASARASTGTGTGAGHASGRTHVPAPARRRGRRGGKFRLALAGGAAVLVTGAAGLTYAVSQHGASASLSASSATARRPDRPVLAATLTVPGGGTVDTTWISPDGKLIAASGQGSSVYVWNTATRALVTTLTPPTMEIGTTVYSMIIDNVAFSADDSAVTVLVYPNVPAGAPTPNGSSSYAVYRWNLPAGGKPTLVWSVQTPSIISISNDNNTALTAQGSQVNKVTLTPQLSTAPTVTLPGGVDGSYPPPYELDQHGDRMIYHPSGTETYVWSFASTRVIAKLKSGAYTVLSTDGKTILEANPSNYATGSSAPPTLWDVATQSSVTPSDPRWKQQLRQPWQVYSWDTYSTDGGVLLTRRPGGLIDLWSTATGKHLLTVTDPTYRADGTALAGPGGSDVVILHGEKTLNGEDEYRQVDVWETPLPLPPAP